MHLILRNVGFIQLDSVICVSKGKTTNCWYGSCWLWIHVWRNKELCETKKSFWKDNCTLAGEFELRDFYTDSSVYLFYICVCRIVSKWKSVGCFQRTICTGFTLGLQLLFAAMPIVHFWKKKNTTKALMYVFYIFYNSVRCLPAVLLLEVKCAGRNFSCWWRKKSLVALRLAFSWQRSWSQGLLHLHVFLYLHGILQTAVKLGTCVDAAFLCI